MLRVCFCKCKDLSWLQKVLNYKVNLLYDPLLFCRLHEVTSNKIVFIKNEEHLAEYIPLHILPKPLF